MNSAQNTNEDRSGGSELNVQLGAEFDDIEERYLRDTLAILQDSYAKAAKPYIDRLAAIHARKPPQPMIVTLEQAQALGLELPNAPVRSVPDTKL